MKYVFGTSINFRTKSLPHFQVLTSSISVLLRHLCLTVFPVFPRQLPRSPFPFRPILVSLLFPSTKPISSPLTTAIGASLSFVSPKTSQVLFWIKSCLSKFQARNQANWKVIRSIKLLLEEKKFGRSLCAS